MKAKAMKAHPMKIQPMNARTGKAQVGQAQEGRQPGEYKKGCARIASDTACVTQNRLCTEKRLLACGELVVDLSHGVSVAVQEEVEDVLGGLLLLDLLVDVAVDEVDACAVLLGIGHVC